MASTYEDPMFVMANFLSQHLCPIYGILFHNISTIHNRMSSLIDFAVHSNDPVQLVYR